MTTKYNFLAHQMYGMKGDAQAEVDVSARDAYGRAVLTIAGADGLSESEREYFVNLARAMDVPEELAERYSAYDTKSSTLEALLAPLRGKSTPAIPCLLYDAIKVSSVDGYSEKERAKVDQAAKLLGVRPEHVRALEGVVAAETALREARLGLFAAIGAETGK